jgi:hypothetical protein
MKRVIFLILFVALIGLFFWSCENPSGSDSSTPSNGGGEVPSTFAENFWGEWIRIDNGDTWYISGKKIDITGSVKAVPSNPVLTQQSSQVVQVSESNRDPYYLFASRRANATLRVKAISMDNTSANNVSSSVSRAVSVGGMEIGIINPKQPEKPEVRAQLGSDGDYLGSGYIGGDELIIRFPGLPGMSDITLPPTPIPPEGDPTYQPPVVPIPIVTQGVNLKASIKPQYAEDSTRLYADGTSMDFLLEIENVGTEDCTAATYEIVYTGSDLVIIDSAPNRRLGTLTPKERGGSTYKKSIPLTITGKPLSGALAFTDAEIGIRINDTIVRKTWNDSVSIRYNKAKIPFRIRSEYPVQGIIKVPGGKTHHFKTSDSSYGNCVYTIDLPWSTEDYFVIFSGATAATESAYSMGINAAPSQEFSVFDDTGIYEPNNDEGSAVLIQNSDSIMAYLHGGGQADIDYYRINMGNKVPVVKLVPLETYAFTDVDGNADGTINPGESAYLDMVMKNETEQSKTVTVSASVTGSNAGYVTLDKESATISGISPQYYVSLTDYQSLSADDVDLFVNYNLGNALKFTISESCPEDTSISILLSFSDAQGITWTETLSLKVIRGDRSMVIENPATDCVLTEYSSGNGDGEVNPGESFTYAIKVKNTGTAAVSALEGTLATTASNVSIATSSISLGTLDPGASGTADFRFTVSASFTPGTVIPFALTLRSSTGTTWKQNPPDVPVKALVPRDLQAAANVTDSINLTWNAVSHTVAGYHVYYATSEAGPYNMAGSTTGAAYYAHTGLAAGTSYYYKVSAFGDGWEGERSGAVRGKTWLDMVFNKAVSGTVAEGVPEYYRFYITSGKTYAFTSDTSAQVMTYNYNSEQNWFSLSGDSPQSQSANFTGWALIKFAASGAYNFTITSGEAALNSFVFDSITPSSTGTINEADKTIFVLVPSGTDLTSLTPTVAAVSGWTCVTTGEQDFSGPVEYCFTNSVGPVQVYTVTAKTLKDLAFNKAVSGTVAEGVPEYYRFYVSSGKTYTFTSGTSAQVMKNDGSSWFNLDDYESPESQSANFTGWALIKFAASGAYNFTIVSNEAAVNSFVIDATTPSSTGAVNEADKTIFVLIPFSANPVALTPTVTAVSGWTCATTGPQNFSGPVEYRFTNSDGQAQVYTVTAEILKDLAFNKTVSGTITAGRPDYYLFYVSNGVSYAFTSDKPVEFKKHDGFSWFNLDSYDSPLSKTADFSGWVIVKFEEAGAYTLKVVSAEAAVSGFVFDSTTPPSVGTIDQAAKTISVLVPYNTNLASLTPTVTPAADWTCATTGEQNFSGPVEYRFAKDSETQVYTVTVARRGQGGITIDPPGGDISIAGFPTESFTVSRTGSPTSYFIQISDTSYSSYEWYVDDMQKTADSGSGDRNFTVRAADCPIGSHTVTLIVYKNGVPYSNERRFTVTN